MKMTLKKKKQYKIIIINFEKMLDKWHKVCYNKDTTKERK